MLRNRPNYAQSHGSQSSAGTVTRQFDVSQCFGTHPSPDFSHSEPLVASDCDQGQMEVWGRDPELAIHTQYEITI